MKVDIAIMTIREDEFTAVRRRFKTERQRIPDGRTYLIGEVKTEKQTYAIAIARCSEQGTDASQRLAHHIIHNLDPRLILVVGIAGGVPRDEFTLGDVVVSTRIVNPNVDAWHADGTTDYTTRGGPPHPLVENIVSLLPGEPQLVGWTDTIQLERPTLDPQQENITGDDEWRERVRKSLNWHFGEEQNRPATFTIGHILSSNHLMKDPTRLSEILKTHRSILAVEMESAGVYEAAQGMDHQYPVMAIRGISDIVGLQRDSRWTAYACQTAAAFTYAFIMTDPLDPPLNKVSLQKTIAPSQTSSTQHRGSEPSLDNALHSLRHLDEPGLIAFDFYIRAVEADRNWALWIKWYINSLGFSVFAENFRPGAHPFVERNEIMPRARRVIVLFSHDAVKDEHIYNDWIEVRASDPTGKLGRLIPIRVREYQTELNTHERYPTNIRDITLSGLNRDEAKEALINGIEALQNSIENKLKQKEPPFPGENTIPDPVSQRTEPPTPLPPPLIWTPLNGQIDSISQVDGKQQQTATLFPKEILTNPAHPSIAPESPPPTLTSVEFPTSMSHSILGQTQTVLPVNPNVILPPDNALLDTSPPEPIIPTLSVPVQLPLSSPINSPQISIPGPKVTPQPSIHILPNTIPGPTVIPHISAQAPLPSSASSAVPSHHILSGFSTPCAMQLTTQHQLQEYSIMNMNWTLDGTYFVTFEEEGIIRKWDRSRGWMTKAFQLPLDTISSVRTLACSQNGNYLAFVNGNDRFIHIFDFQASNMVKPTFEGHAEEITHLAWSADTYYLASAAADKTVRVWSIADRMQKYLYKCDEAPGLVTWSQDGHLAYVSGETIHICNQFQSCIPFKFQGQASFLAWSPDNQSIAAVIGSKIYGIRHLRGEQKMIYDGHFSNESNVVVNALAWSPSGAYIASAGKNDLHIWSPDNSANYCIQHVSKQVYALLWPRDDELLILYSDGDVDRGEITF